MKQFLQRCALMALALSAPFAAQAQVSLTGGTYSQNFDTLANSGTSSTLPAGWLMSESGTNANTTYTAGTGSGNAGDTYSFGAAAATDRAFGGLLSGSLTPTVGACFTNNTGNTISSFEIAYTGEQWRYGATGRADRLDFQYSTSATQQAAASIAATSTVSGRATHSARFSFRRKIRCSAEQGSIRIMSTAHRIMPFCREVAPTAQNGTAPSIR